MLRFISDPTHGTWLAALVFTSSIAVSCCMHDFSAFSRSGNLIVCISIIMLSRPAITRTRIAMEVISEETGLDVNSSEHYRVQNRDTPAYVHESELNKLALQQRSPMLALVGTVAAAFGDLLNEVVGWR